MTTDQILHAHGYHDGTDEDRLMQVFKDLARERAVLAVYKLVLLPHQHSQAANGVQMLVDS